VYITPQVLACGPAKLDREIAERQRVEAELRTMRVELESRVAQRTEELSKANAALQAEIAVRKEVEKALEHERGLFEVTLTSIGDAVVVTDTVGRVVFLNHVAWDMIGCQEDVSGQPLTAICKLVDEHTGHASTDLVAQVLNPASRAPAAECLLLPANARRADRQSCARSITTRAA
jgi:PAS domain-containing protein